MIAQTQNFLFEVFAYIASQIFKFTANWVYNQFPTSFRALSENWQHPFILVWEINPSDRGKLCH